MIFHENEKCPVCDKLFNESDDIVICPHCGTPHHRDCYNQLGHCANSSRHKEGFDYRADKKDNNTEHVSNNSVNEQSAKQNDSAKNICQSCGAEIDKAAPFCNHCGEKQSNPQYNHFTPGFNPSFSAGAGSFGQSDSEIDGVSAVDVAITVKSNTARFLPKFVKNKKVSWNWAGFIFGPYYLFFRKMYKEGIIAMAVNLIASLVVNGLYMKQSSALSNYVLAHAQTYEDMLKLTANPSEELMKLTEAVMPMYLIMAAVAVVIGIVIAMFSDYFYRTKVLSVIKKVDENLADGGSFVQNSMFAMDMNMNQSDMRKMYLSKLGGTNIFSPVVAYCALQIISSIITKI